MCPRCYLTCSTPGPLSPTGAGPRSRPQGGPRLPGKRSARRSHGAGRAAPAGGSARVSEPGLRRSRAAAHANQRLLRENQRLRAETRGLALENQELRCRLQLDEGEAESQVDETRLVTGSAESAALRLRAPLQQVQAQQSPFLMTSTWILMALTLQTLSLISCWASWTAWTQTCSYKTVTQSQPVWKSWKKIFMERNRIPYQLPPLPLWGPHQQSWKPLMN
uniref:X-box binding protein 1 n=1 Tax=Crocodylus porosus TaxID=8502 RepID=A0A7M4ETC5_CROPO